jgi:hypothetical protein
MEVAIMEAVIMEAVATVVTAAAPVAVLPAMETEDSVSLEALRDSILKKQKLYASRMELLLA